LPIPAGATNSEEVQMTDAFWLAGVTALLFVYLFYALLTPERF
jgi:K+-transporting ATPase KdpF subunit